MDLAEEIHEALPMLDAEPALKKAAPGVVRTLLPPFEKKTRLCKGLC